MVSLSPFLNGRPALRNDRTNMITPQSPAVLACCKELLADIPPHHAERVIGSLQRMRRASDLVQLRTALYTAIALSHGELVAQERLKRFDAVARL